MTINALWTLLLCCKLSLRLGGRCCQPFELSQGSVIAASQHETPSQRTASLVHPNGGFGVCCFCATRAHTRTRKGAHARTHQPAQVISPRAFVCCQLRSFIHPLFVGSFIPLSTTGQPRQGSAVGSDPQTRPPPHGPDPGRGLRRPRRSCRRCRGGDSRSRLTGPQPARHGAGGEPS